MVLQDFALESFFKMHSHTLHNLYMLCPYILQIKNATHNLILAMRLQMTSASISTQMNAAEWWKMYIIGDFGTFIFKSTVFVSKIPINSP